MAITVVFPCVVCRYTRISVQSVDHWNQPATYLVEGKMGFFEWIREGVRQAVVLGLADAVDDVGVRNQGEDFGPALAASLRERVAEPRSGSATIEGSAAKTSRAKGRRLGRSLSRTGEPLKKAA